MDKALVIVLALGLVGVLWFFRRSHPNSPDRAIAKVQVLLWSGLLVGNLPRALAYQPLWLAVASFALSGLLFGATVVHLVRARRERRA